MRPLILLSNDDGVGAAGIQAAAEMLATHADVIIAAPDRERSATGHAISLSQPLRAHEIRPAVFSIDGTPVDCVYLALLHLVPRKPDLVVSGINHGFNLGSDVFYSGTVAAAIEGALRGVPAIAASLERKQNQDFKPAVSILERVVVETLRRLADPHMRLNVPRVLNLNVPSGHPSGLDVTILGERVYRDLVDVRKDLRGQSYYWIGGPELDVAADPGTDLAAIQAGRASVTPLNLDLTHHGIVASVRDWSLA